MKSIIGIRDLSREDIDTLIELALGIKREGSAKLVAGKKVASLFFENSTRTRLSFETAAKAQDVMSLGFSGAEGTSVKKGEPVADTVRMFAAYGYDAVVMRHHLEGAARLAADVLEIPIINAGDGSNGHPTQTLLDLMTMKELKGSIDGLKIAIVGDLKYGRTVHSLLQALELYYVELWLVSPPSLQIPQWRVEEFKRHTGRNVLVTENLEDAIPEVDVLYMTRVQRERFPEGFEGELEYKKVSGAFKLKASLLRGAKPECSVLHPLPRFKENIELALDVDSTRHAAYFLQAANGLFMRQALLQQVLLDRLKGPPVVENSRFMLWRDFPISHGSKKGENLLYRLDNGTQIDHIEQGKGLIVCRLLGLDKPMDYEVVPAWNIRSAKFGRKDVIAVHHVTLSPEQLYRIALVSKTATINLVQDAKVLKKGKVVLPPEINSIILCSNPKCVSRPEHFEHVESKFSVLNQDPLRLRCHFCEQVLQREELEFHYKNE